jgi:NAD(P)H dehydrogenase (quinone)
MISMNRHLIISSLHRDESFLFKGVDGLINRLIENGANVVLRDLYAMNFDPVLTINDFTSLKSGNLPEDIAIEQTYISEADYIWVIFPIWWSGMPAILKGYIDRIFLSGFAYKMVNNKPVGLLTNKKVIILNSMGLSQEEYQQSGMFDALRLTIDKGIFEFAGMKVIEHMYFTSIMSADEKTKLKYLDDINNLADKVLRFNKISNDMILECSKLFSLN